MKSAKTRVSKTPKKSPQGHRGITSRSLTNRARVTNKMGLLPSVDGRSSVARRWHDLIWLHCADLGGEDNLSQAELSIVRRAATLTVELEHMEQKFALAEDGASFDQLRIYQMTVNTLRRTLESLGLRRRQRDITPPRPLDYAKDYARRKALEAEDVEAA